MAKRSLKRFLNKVTCGDARTLLLEIPADSIDVIMTDPPWAKNALWCYELIGQQAQRILKPGGWCFAYTGGYCLPEAMAALDRWLRWYWLMKARNSTGDFGGIVSRKMRVASRDVMVFSKGVVKIPKGVWLYSDYDEPKEKGLHPWQQGSRFPAQVLSRIAAPGQLLLDCFTGAGTFPAVAKELGLDYIAFDIDPEACRIARKRLRAVKRGG